jgi:peptide/nickel transport system substrate-binding protein
MWPYHWAYDRSIPSFGFDPDEARRLLDEAGYPVKETPDGPVRFRLKCLLPSDVAQFEGFALFIQKNLHDVGVALDLEPVTTRTLIGRMGPGDFDTFLFEMANARTLSWPYRFLHSARDGAPVLLDWGYQGADAALDRIRHASNDDEIRAGVGALQRALYDDPPAVFISWDERSRAVSRRFQVPARPGYDVFTSALLWQWKPAPADPD